MFGTVLFQAKPLAPYTSGPVSGNDRLLEKVGVSTVEQGQSLLGLAHSHSAASTSYWGLSRSLSKVCVPCDFVVVPG